VEKIEAEIEMRKVELRPKLTQAVAEAAAQGDRSENFEYYAAKRENNHNNSRIRYLERVLRTATIVESHDSDDKVSVDKEVVVYLPDDDEEETYTLVTPIRADSLHNIVSIESPIGRALLGHRVGDRITVKANEQYSYPVEIRAIRASDAAGTMDINEF